MQKTSSLYKQIISGQHWKEYRLVIGESGILIDRQGDRITFGGVGILVDTGGVESGYSESIIVEMTTEVSMFPDNDIAVGACVSGEISASILRPAATVPTMARIVPYVRVTNGTQSSEWVQKGVFFVDQREYQGDKNEVVVLHGCDAIRKAEILFPSSTNSWPRTDINVVRDIASALDIQVDDRTVSIMTNGYMIQYPAEYSCREVLGYIAAMYAGCFVMSDTGELRLIRLNEMPPETSFLVDGTGFVITFGGDRIRV